MILVFADCIGEYEDVCCKVVRHCRANMIGNEAQGLALFLSMLTMYAPDCEEYTSVVIHGELSSGKTRVVKIIMGDGIPADKCSKYGGLFPHRNLKHITSSSPKATIYAKDLREGGDVKCLVLAEYQKLQDDTKEWLKAQSGDDGAFAYETTDVANKDVYRIEQPKRVFVMTYAQVEMDGELKSRMISFSVEENKLVNREVCSIKHGKPYAEYRDRTYTLKGDHETEKEIREIVEQVASEEGGLAVVNPFWAALEDFEDCSRASSKRVSGMIEALFRSSARVNWQNREITDGGEVMMSAQDIVNVLSFADIVQSMILEVDVIDLAIIRFLSIDRRPREAQEIIARIDDAGLAELKGKELIQRMDKLENDNYVLKFWDPETKRNKWYRNRRKHVHPLTVYWDRILELDDCAVMDPITGHTFDDIVKYGKWFEETCTAGLDDDEEDANPDDIRAQVWSTVEKLLSSGRQYCSTRELKNDCRAQHGMTDLAQFNLVDPIVQDMIDQNVIEYNKRNKCYVLLDRSVRKSRNATLPV